MPRRLSVLFLVFSIFSAASYAVTFTDSISHEVTVDNPSRVALLNSSLADAWVLAGGKAAITIEEAVERGFASADAIVVGNSSGMRIDSELLYVAKPDLIIGSADLPSHVALYERFSSLGIPVALFRMESFEDYLEVFRILTEITGRSDLYDKYTTDQIAEIECLKEAAREKEYHPKVLLIRSGSAFSSFLAKTAENHFAGAILEDLGAVNIADGDSALSERISLEYVLVENPDMVFVILHGNEDASRDFVLSTFSRPGWRDIKAVQEGRFYILDKELFHFKPCERYAEAYRVLFDLLYGEDI